jgi:hypothetical protein
MADPNRKPDPPPYLSTITHIKGIFNSEEGSGEDSTNEGDQNSKGKEKEKKSEVLSMFAKCEIFVFSFFFLEIVKEKLANLSTRQRTVNWNEFLPFVLRKEDKCIPFVCELFKPNEIPSTVKL